MNTDDWNKWFTDWQKRMAQAFIDDDPEEEEWLRLELEFKMRGTEKPQESRSGDDQRCPSGSGDKDAQEDA